MGDVNAAIDLSSGLVPKGIDLSAGLIPRAAPTGLNADRREYRGPDLSGEGSPNFLTRVLTHIGNSIDPEGLVNALKSVSAPQVASDLYHHFKGKYGSSPQPSPPPIGAEQTGEGLASTLYHTSTPGIAQDLIQGKDMAPTVANAALLTAGGEGLGQVAEAGARGMVNRLPFSDYIGIKSRAAAAFQGLDAKIGDAPVNEAPVMKSLQRVFDLDKKGYSAPDVANKFRDWISERQQTHLTSGPNGEMIDTAGSSTPLTWKDARDFYSAINEAIDWDKMPGGKGSRMNHAMQGVSDALSGELRTTAKANQSASIYDQALSDYTKAINVGKVGRTVGNITGRAVGYMSPVHPWAAGSVGAKIGQSVGGDVAQSVLTQPTPPPSSGSLRTPIAIRAATAAAIMDLAKQGEISNGEMERRLKLLGVPRTINPPPR